MQYKDDDMDMRLDDYGPELSNTFRRILDEHGLTFEEVLSGGRTADVTACRRLLAYELGKMIRLGRMTFHEAGRVLGVDYTTVLYHIYKSEFDHLRLNMREIRVVKAIHRLFGNGVLLFGRDGIAAILHKVAEAIRLNGELTIEDVGRFVAAQPRIEDAGRAEDAQARVQQR